MYDKSKIPDTVKSLSSFERDCCITVALKISDDSCKMDDYEKSIFMLLYDNLVSKESDLFQESVRQTIAEARTSSNAMVYAEVKRLREAAMDRITRPKMKAFKASIRAKIAS